MNLEEAKQKFNQAIDFFEKNEIDHAKEVLEELSSNINSDQELYYKIQLLLGEIHWRQGKLSLEIQTYKKIPIKYKSLYMRAQVNLGTAYMELKQFDKAVKAYIHVSLDFQSEYAQAQLNLGNIYAIYKRKWDLAISSYENVPKEQNEIYIQAQWNILIAYLNQGKVELFHEKLKSIDFNEEVLNKFTYHINIFREMINKNIFNQIPLLILKVEKILENLVVDKCLDSFIAHYTAPSIAYLMLNHKNQEHPSKLRLNPTDFMNDPTEGALIHQLFSLKAQEKPNAQIEQHKSFIGCFTLHHDSLNQFRLYGKENQREASGVSLVLNREQLFERESNFTFLTHNSIVLQPESVNSENIESTKKLSEDKPTQQQSTDLKLPLFRCIYFDPDSGLIHVAQREEWTFCREKGSCQDNGWSDYKDKIDQVNKSVRELILDIQQFIMDINPAENSDEAELIEEILLPLRYLIKHYAFKEEQECRTIYITQWNDEKIQLDPNLKRVYVDYQSILPAMEKIFLSVGALHHESTLQYLGQTADKTFNVKRSHNPFRT